jgi:hypothetical protein
MFMFTSCDASTIENAYLQLWYIQDMVLDCVSVFAELMWSCCLLCRLDVEEDTADCEVQLDSFEQTQLAPDIAIIHVPVRTISDNVGTAAWHVVNSVEYC